MNTVYEVREYLKRFYVFIYTGNKNADLNLIEAELAELKENSFIENDLYLKFILVIRKERRLLKKIKKLSLLMIAFNTLFTLLFKHRDQQKLIHKQLS